MPKDNEVDEKVMPEPLTYGMRRKGETAVIGLIPPKVHANPPKVPEYLRDYEEVPLYSAATVAELRAEVESERKLRLRAEGLCSQWITRHDFALESLNELTADRNAQRDRADAAERRVGELENLLGAWYAEESRYGARLQAPGHHHQVPGIWDSDNGPIAGKPCAKCALWQQIRSITGADPT